MMTGRVVDSFTNISTVKLFSHADREERWMQAGMERFLSTVRLQMRLSTTQDIILNLINVWLVASTTGLGLWLWTQNQVDVGAIAIAVPLAIRLNNMAHWIMWEFAALFENVGTVRDGISSISLSRAIVDAPDAVPLDVSGARIEFENVTFHYDANTGPNRVSVLNDLSLDLREAKKSD